MEMTSKTEMNPPQLSKETPDPAQNESVLYRRFKSFDVYRKVPQDLTEPTFSGAISTRNIRGLFNGSWEFGGKPLLDPDSDDHQRQRAHWTVCFWVH